MEKSRIRTIKLAVALLLYLVLAIVSTFVFDGVLRTVLWIFFAGLAIKTIIASQEDRTMD